MCGSRCPARSSSFGRVVRHFEISHLINLAYVFAALRKLRDAAGSVVVGGDISLSDGHAMGLRDDPDPRTRLLLARGSGFPPTAGGVPGGGPQDRVVWGSVPDRERRRPDSGPARDAAGDSSRERRPACRSFLSGVSAESSAAGPQAGLTGPLGHPSLVCSLLPQ